MAIIDYRDTDPRYDYTYQADDTGRMRRGHRGYPQQTEDALARVRENLTTILRDLRAGYSTAGIAECLHKTLYQLDYDTEGRFMASASHEPVRFIEPPPPPRPRLTLSGRPIKPDLP